MKSKLLTAAFILMAAWSALPAQNSLWINDPQLSWWWQTGTITEATLTVRPKGLYLQYGLYLTLSPQETSFENTTQLEAVLDFSLPPGSIVIDSWLWVGKDIVQGKLLDRWSASEIYEEIVDRRRDPSVLYKQWEGQYQLRVYPLKKGETRKVKITYLVPVEWAGGKVECPIPSDLLMTSSTDPDLHVLTWAENGFGQPSFSDPEITFTAMSDAEFGTYNRAKIPQLKLAERPVLKFNTDLVNNCFASVYRGEEDYYQLSLNPADFIEQVESNRIILVLDYKSGNTSHTKSQILYALKNEIMYGFGPADQFNLIYAGLRVEKAFEEWKPVTSENLDAAISKALNSATYSNLPGELSEAIDFIKKTGGTGSILLAANSDNFGNYTDANNLIRDLRKLQDPLYPMHIADLQDRNYGYYYIGNRYYQGQEYLYVNLSKISGGFYQNIRETGYLPTLLGGVLSSVQGMITAFDMYTAPVDGFCYGRFGQDNSLSFPVNQQVTQVGKFYGNTPFMVYLTGLYKSKPFSKLIRIEESQMGQADSALPKMWHGRYIAQLEAQAQNNTTAQEILYESLNNRVLSIHSAFLCLEPRDTISICRTCKDESRLTGIGTFPIKDTAGFIRLYPNPFKDRLTISIDSGTWLADGSVQISIFSLAGQLVYQESREAASGQSLTIIWNGESQSGEKVPAGNYFVMIRAGGLTWNKQVVKSE
jgi:Ca-activated chloride channel family protein